MVVATRRLTAKGNNEEEEEEEEEEVFHLLTGVQTLSNRLGKINISYGRIYHRVLVYGVV